MKKYICHQILRSLTFQEKYFMLKVLEKYAYTKLLHIGENGGRDKHKSLEQFASSITGLHHFSAQFTFNFSMNFLELQL